MATQLKKLTLIGPPGATSVSSSLLAYASLITVHREGSLQYPIETIPTGMESNVYFEPGFGKLTWSDERAFPTDVDEFGVVARTIINIVYTVKPFIGVPGIITP
jgi:hypothetical protein